MAVKLEKVVKTFYDKLEEGKIMGRKCPACGAVEYPPVYACNFCGSLETEWYEISGKAKMKTCILPGLLSSKPDMNEFAPYCFGEVELEEGPTVNAVILGINKKKKKQIADQMPVDVKAKIGQREGYKTVFFELVED